MFITTDAQLLRFPAAAVRPQGRPAGGMAGIRLSDGASVVWFGALGPSAASGQRPTGGRRGHRRRPVWRAAGHRRASVKVTPFAEYPPKGRATGGVRCQRFLKGEDGLIAAWVGPAPRSAPPILVFLWTWPTFRAAATAQASP